MTLSFRGKLQFILFFYFLLTGFLFNIFAADGIPVQWYDKTGILVVHSYQESYSWSREMNRGIETCLNDSLVDAEIYSVYLDSRRLRENGRFSNRLKVALEDYKTEHIGMVILCDYPAYNAFLEIDDPSYKNVPIVFCGVEMVDPDVLKKHPNMTGIVQGFDYINTYVYGKKLFPKVKNLFIITDNTMVGAIAKSSAISQLSGKTDDLTVSYWDGREGITSNQLAEKLLDLDTDDLIILSGWTRGYDGTYLDENYSYSFLSSICNAPLFSVDNISIGKGAIGGFIVSGYEQGYAAMKMGVNILHGKNISSLPVQSLIKGYPSFDWNELKRWDIDPELLPEESQIVNKPLDFFDVYRFQIYAAIITFIILILVLIFIVIYHFKYRRIIRQKEVLMKKNNLLADRYRMIFNDTFKGIFLYNINERKIVEVNEGLCRMLHYSENELLSFQPFVFSKTFDQKNALYHSDEQETIDCTLRTKSGKHIYVTAAYTHFCENDVKYIYVIYIDRSEMHAIQKHMAEQRNELSTTLASIAEAVISINMNKEVISINPVALDYLQYINSPAECIGKNINTLLHFEIPAEDFNLNAQIDKALTTGKPSYFHENAMLKPLRENTSPIYIAGNISNISNGSELYGFVIVFHDITEEHKQREELIRARNKALEADKLKSAFLANMSHEIRTPLNGIIGFANLLIDGNYPEEDKKQFINIISSNCHTLLGLINDVLDLSRIESGALSFRTETVNAVGLVCSVIDSMRVNIPPDITLQKEIPSGEISIVTDNLRLTQVLTNLVNNAIKFTSSGSITVGYKLVEEEQKIRFFVRDTGCGIAEDDLKNIFGRFYKKDEFVQGAGLGLSICEAIVTNLGGEIEVMSELGKGTEFSIILPLVKGKVMVAPISESEMTPIYPPIMGGNVILVAEDDDSNYTLIDALLGKEYTVVRARNGIEVLEVVKACQVELILMDVKMPLMSGLEALVELRKMSSVIPVIMQTAYAFDTDKEKAKEAGCNDFITKPIRIEELKEILNKYLR